MSSISFRRTKLQLLVNPTRVNIAELSPCQGIWNITDSRDFIVGKLSIGKGLDDKTRIYLRHQEVTAEVVAPPNVELRSVIEALLSQFNMVLAT